jgi:myo-inositol-1(or 4)-monophosphatase
VACGRADAYFESGLQPWDIAAGVLLVREAGGRVTDYRGANLSRMDVAESRGRQVIAGNLKVSAELQKAITASGYAAKVA